MSDFIKNSLPNLSVEGLMDVVKDAEFRIGSYVAGVSENVNANDPYLERQREIINLVQQEFTRRRQDKE